jgi:probable F420-dependent oxidoreductase
MRIGLVIFPTEYSIRPDELARAAEERGFESLFVTEHTHIPVSRRSPWSGGKELPQHYWHTLDPFVGLSAAAMSTSTLKVGTGVCLVTEHDPIVLAKTVATLDLLADGRFLFGVGGGWNAEEMEDHGTPFVERFRIMEERVVAMRHIWTEEEPSFDGRYVQFEPMWSYPKPVQKSGPPVLWGGESIHTMRRVAQHGDGWFPRANQFEPAAAMAKLRELADQAGRPMESIDVTVYGARPARAALDQLASTGVTRALFTLPSEARDPIERRLDELAPFATTYNHG